MNFNKLMSILIGTAVVSSIVPGTVVNASTKLEVLDGTIYEAKAYLGGKYVFEGYKGEDQDNGIYFFNGEEDVEIEDVDSIGSKYGMNYINFKDDNVLFNLITGQAEEDDEESKLDMMEIKFKSSVVRKADRYENTQNLTRVGKIVDDTFSGVWYEYELTGDDTDEKYTVYLSDTGKYIDVSETLNIEYFNGKEKINLDTYDDLEEKGFVKLLEKPLIMDQENIYKLTVILPPAASEEDSDENISQLNLSPELMAGLEAIQGLVDAGIAKTYIQKISMEQGNKKDGAYIPKKVTSFETYDFDVIDFLIENIKGNNTARVSGNNLYTMELNEDKDAISMRKYVLKKIKDKDAIEGKTVDKKVLELDEDFDDIIDESIEDYDVDITGNLWVLNKGKIKKAVNGKLETIYTTDRTMNRLSVCADNSLIVWNTEDEIYSVAAPQPVEEDKDEEEIENPSEDAGSKDEVEFTSGWIKNADGTWNFKKEDGTLALGWLKDNNTWYYFNTQGIMQTGWVKDGSTWYYLNASGAMQTGWVKDGSTWYYLNASGAMETGWIKDGSTWYYLNGSGAMQTGWIKDTNGKWYYLYDNGAMAYSTVIDGYKLDASGAWIE